MLDVHLKMHTHMEHASLEKKMLRRIDGIQTVEDYAVFLAELYPFYAGIETSVRPWLTEALNNDFEKRRKASRLLNDISAISDKQLVVRQCENLTFISTYHSALGAMYVMEGSTLGGPAIARIISTRLRLNEGFTFFLSYGSDLAGMWTSFKGFLREPLTANEEAAVISGARQTFLTFNNWLSVS